ncbi:MAG: hypothetical protein ACTHLZ_11075 [Tepidisphaeraceae bacterium]
MKTRTMQRGAGWMLSAAVAACLGLGMIGCDKGDVAKTPDDSVNPNNPTAASGTPTDPTNNTTGGGAMPGGQNGAGGGLNGPTTRGSSTGSGMNGGGATGMTTPNSRATGDAGSGAVESTKH